MIPSELGRGFYNTPRQHSIWLKCGLITRNAQANQHQSDLPQYKQVNRNCVSSVHWKTTNEKQQATKRHAAFADTDNRFEH